MNEAWSEIEWSNFLLPYKQAVEELRLKLMLLDQELRARGKHSPIEYIDGRVKGIGSILSKAKRKGIAREELADKIEDIAGVRIVCQFVEDIELMISLLRQRDGYDMHIVEEVDYVTNQKPSGYRSYHMVILYKLLMADGPKEVFCEIQIRTLSMNFWATIEHTLKYKYTASIPKQLQDRLRSSAEAAFRLDTEMSKIRSEISQSQKIIQYRDDLVDGVLKDLHNMSELAKTDGGAKNEEVGELMRDFTNVFESGSIEKLESFNRRLKAIVQAAYENGEN